MARNAGDKVGEMASDFADRTTETLDNTRQYVREHPATGVAIAAIAGMVAGSILTLALRSSRD